MKDLIHVPPFKSHVPTALSYDLHYLHDTPTSLFTLHTFTSLMHVYFSKAKVRSWYLTIFTLN